MTDEATRIEFADADRKHEAWFDFEPGGRLAIYVLNKWELRGTAARLDPTATIALRDWLVNHT